MTKRIVYLDEAADILGLSKEALRKRISRGSIKANKDAAGKWQVVLEDEGQDVEGRGRQAIKDAYIQDLRERIEELRKDKEHLRQLLNHRDEEIAWSNMQRVQLEKRVQVLLEAPKPGRRWWPFSSKE
jgi:predicted ArsR family transcriptional regulator